MVVAKLFHVQIIKHELLKERAEANWDREIPFGGIRGDIIDRNGELIVGNRLAPTLYFMPSQNHELKNTATALASILGVNAADLEKKMSKKAYMVKLHLRGKTLQKSRRMKLRFCK